MWEYTSCIISGDGVLDGGRGSGDVDGPEKVLTMGGDPGANRSGTKSENKFRTLWNEIGAGWVPGLR